MKSLTVVFLLVPTCLAMPRERRQAFGGGLDPSFGPGFGDPASPFSGNLMSHAGMDSGLFGHNQGQGRGLGMAYDGFGYNGPRGYNAQADINMGYAGHGPAMFGGQSRAYGYEPRQPYGMDNGMYEPRQHFGGGESMYEPSSRFGGGGGGGYMGGDQFIGQDPNIAGGMAGMGGMGGGLGSLAGFGGGMGGDGMDDMMKMQAEMQQMQLQMKQQQRPAVDVTPGKGNTSTNVEKIGNNLLVTNQTRFVDNNDGLTQGFFQEFHIFPGMETTTASSRDSTPEQSNGRLVADSSARQFNPVVNPAAVFGFAPPDNFFNPRKVAATGADSALLKDHDSNLLPGANEVKTPPKKAFSSEKFEVLGDNFNRAFDSL